LLALFFLPVYKLRLAASCVAEQGHPGNLRV
jgi:hypothetical protein